MANSVYQINKGINKAIEFRGLKAQYIGYLAAGLVSLMILFAVLYVAGVSLWICIPLITGLGSLLFVVVYRYSHKYGQYGLLKKAARKNIPRYIRFHSMNIFSHLINKTDGAAN